MTRSVTQRLTRAAAVTAGSAALAAFALVPAQALTSGSFIGGLSSIKTIASTAPARQ